MAKWKKYKFSDFVEINPPVKIPKDQKISFVEMRDLQDGRRYCQPSQERELSGGSRFQNRDTLFARITPCLENGKICQVRNLKNSIGFGSTEFYVFRGRKDVSDPDFVYYLSRWSGVRDHAEINLDGTSGRQRVPKHAFEDLVLDLPDLEEQIQITSILSCLDNKIDLLNAQNCTLEKIAETMFRETFKEEVNGEWEAGSLGQILTVVSGTTPSTSVAEYWGGDIHWTSPKDITLLDGIYLFDTERKITDLGLRKIGSGLMPKGSLLMSSRAPVGVLAFTEISLAINQGYIGIIDNKGFSKEFIYLWLKANMDKVLSHANGSTFLEISKSSFKSLALFKPPRTVLKRFQSLVEPIFDKIKANEMQTRSLCRIRNMLLPKLLSGEISLRSE